MGSSVRQPEAMQPSGPGLRTGVTMLVLRRARLLGLAGEVWVLAFAVLVLFALWWVGRSAGDGVLGFRLDDAWIHMVYGREIANGGYPAYNPGIPATGATSLLWAYWLAVLHLVLGPSHV